MGHMWILVPCVEPGKRCHHPARDSGCLPHHTAQLSWLSMTQHSWGLNAELALFIGLFNTVHCTMKCLSKTWPCLWLLPPPTAHINHHIPLPLTAPLDIYLWRPWDTTGSWVRGSVLQCNPATKTAQVWTLSEHGVKADTTQPYISCKEQQQRAARHLKLQGSVPAPLQSEGQNDTGGLRAQGPNSPTQCQHTASVHVNQKGCRTCLYNAQALWILGRQEPQQLGTGMAPPVRPWPGTHSHTMASSCWT